MFHAVGALDVVIDEPSHDSLQVSCMNQIMEMYKSDPFLLLSLYQSNRPGRMSHRSDIVNPHGARACANQTAGPESDDRKERNFI